MRAISYTDQTSGACAGVRVRSHASDGQDCCFSRFTHYSMLVALYQVTADNQSAVFVKRQNINMKKLTTTFNCLSCPTLREKCPNTELFLVRMFTQCNIQD